MITLPRTPSEITEHDAPNYKLFLIDQINYLGGQI